MSYSGQVLRSSVCFFSARHKLLHIRLIITYRLKYYDQFIIELEKQNLVQTRMHIKHCSSDTFSVVQVPSLPDLTICNFLALNIGHSKKIALSQF